MNNVKRFINNSKKNNSNVLVNKLISNHLHCTIIYVEGQDDEIFYKEYLREVFKNDIPKFAKLNGKTNVINISERSDDKKLLYIVDSDYNDNNYKNPNVVSTTGYSMENFFYYYDEDVNNIDLFIENYISHKCPYKEDYITSKELSKGLKEKLEEFKNKTVNYYAKMKTLVGVNNLKFYGTTEELLKEIDKVDINYEIYDAFKKPIIKERFQQNIDLIKKSGYLWIRGHDLFDITKQYLNEMGPKLGVFHIVENDEILDCANSLKVPEKFEEQFKIMLK